MSKKMLLVAFLVVAAVLVPLGLVGSCVYSLYRNQSEARAELHDHLTRVHSGNSSVAYPLLGSAWRDTQSEDSFVAFHDRLTGILGKYKRGNTTGFKMKSGGETQLTYAASFANGPCTILSTLHHEGGEWRVVGAHYDSALISRALVCPGCDKQAKQFAPFCPSCGQAMESK